MHSSRLREKRTKAVISTVSASVKETKHLRGDRGFLVGEQRGWRTWPKKLNKHHEIYKKKLGVTKVGEVFEINGRRARVVGFTRGIRAFTTTPYVFTSFKNAQGYT